MLYKSFLHLLCSCFGTEPRNKEKKQSGVGLEEEQIIMPETHQTSITPLCGFQYDGKELLWCEWVTLYFYGPHDGMDGMINYIFIKTINDMGVAMIYPAVVMGELEQRETSMDIYPMHQVQLHANHPSITINQNNFFHMIEKSSDTQSFHIKGALKDGTLKWDLMISRDRHDHATAPLVVADRIPFHNEQYLSFVSMIPAGDCHGIVERRGILYSIDGWGEVEHLWGPVLLPTLTWTLAHGYNGNGVSLYWLHVPQVEHEDHDSTPAKRYGCLRIVAEDGTIHKWYSKDYTVQYEFEDDHSYPIRTTIITSAITIKMTVLTISATIPGSASENHVRIDLLWQKGNITAAAVNTYANNIGDQSVNPGSHGSIKSPSSLHKHHTLFGMFEYNRFGMRQIVDRIHKTMDSFVGENESL